MVIGSGPIIIGQAAEFDYAGSQACRSLREEGLTVVLLNSNPATIMTDVNMADRVFIEPINWEFAAEIIDRERPTGLLPTLGGQTGLNIAVELSEHGVLERYGVELLGTPLETIRTAEDRALFKQAMERIGEPVPGSGIAHSLVEAEALLGGVGLPAIIRPAYTLGGSGGGVARTEREFFEIARRGLVVSPAHQILVEQSLLGMKEIEYEVMRDGRDNCIVVCNMENIDPMGVHTGDSIVVAPSQTLTNSDHMMLRAAAIRIIRALGVQGGCNVQFALDPSSDQYYVIEVNPRVSRSSALASKATGYPIAKVAAKVAIGLSLDEITNSVTRSTTACFEPTIDYVVVKIPRWPFDKFRAADRTLGTQMKATGEVMAIDRTLEGALHKAVRSLELDVDSLFSEEVSELSDEQLCDQLRTPDDRRLWLIAEALRRGRDPAELARATTIDRFFIDRLAGMVRMEHEIAAGYDEGLLRRAKEFGFSDSRIAELSSDTEDRVRLARTRAGIRPTYKMVDTCAAEFEAITPYFYSTYELEDEVTPLPGPRAVVLGAGPTRIGQGIEFDYSCVHATWALQRAGYRAIMINNNPETVSTDFDTADRLYFEPLSPEDVMAVIDREQPDGVVVQCGGQTAINLAGHLGQRGVTILGTSPASIDLAEDRRQFDALVERLGIPRPVGGAVTSSQEALEVARRVGFPLVVRPSYVLGGRAMEIVYDESELQSYLRHATKASREHPVLVDRYISGVEIEVDAVSDGDKVLVAGVMEHLERAGIHSGDSIAVYPAQSVPLGVQATVVDYTERLALGIGVRGFLNIQYVVSEGTVYVLEVNPRASRTVPFMSKVTGIPLISIATDVMLGRTLAELGWEGGLAPSPELVAVKMPVFSWAKLIEVDTSLGPEMKSTGEVMGIAAGPDEALTKAFISAGFALPERGRICLTVADRDKQELIPLARALSSAGYQLAATAGTADFLAEQGLLAERICRIGEGSPNIVDLVRDGQTQMVINTMTRGREPERDGFQIRRAAAEYGVACCTSLDTARAAVSALAFVRGHHPVRVRALQDYLPQDVRVRGSVSDSR